MNDTETYITAEQEQDALCVLRASYWQSVRSIADDAADNKDADDDREDALSDYIAESVDGSAWITNTWRARLVRSFSDHDDEYADIGGPGGIDDLDTAITAWAYHAMTADVHDVLDDGTFFAERDAALAAEATT